MPLISISLTDIPLSDMPLGIFAFIAGTFLIAGIVKGLTGLGLPAMSLGLLMVALELRDAMVILVIPLFATNVWQGVTEGHLRTALIRLWPLFSTGVIGIWFAVGVMVTINPTILSIVLGAILIVYAAYSLATPQIRPFGRWEIILSPMAGAITGVIGGLTGSMAVPSVPYMQALGMKRDALIQAMGIWFCLVLLRWVAHWVSAMRSRSTWPSSRPERSSQLFSAWMLGGAFDKGSRKSGSAKYFSPH